MNSTVTTAQELDRVWSERHLRAQAELAGELGRFGEAATGYEDQWRLARLHQFCGMLADEDGDAQAAHKQFTAGAEWGRRAVESDWTRVEGNFWYGVNAIEAARRSGPLAALKTLPRASHHIERAMLIDESYHFAGPVRVWARIMHFKPLVLGGTIDRAITIYRRALQIDDRNSTTLLYYAEALIADQQWNNARRVLSNLLAAPDDPEWLWEQARDRRRAEALLEKLKRQ